MKNERRAALLLMNLDERDRLDVLEQLPQAIRERVMPRLAELSAMGVEPGRNWLHDVIRDEVDVDPRTAAIATIADATADRIQGALEGEPDCVVAALLACARWPWTDDFLSALPSDRRQALQRRASAATGRMPRARVVDSLLTRLGQRLGPSVSAAPAGFEAQLAAQERARQTGGSSWVA